MHFRDPDAALADAEASPNAHRMRELLEAHHEVTSELSLPFLLDRILAAACRLIGAAAGQLCVFGRDGNTAQVVHHGPSHSREFRANTLRTPIRVRGEVFGEIALFAPVKAFTAEDEELLSAFATSAGTAIDNAQLYDEARRGRDWLRASGAIARALLADTDADTSSEVVSSALQVAEADYAALILPTSDHLLHVTAAVGRGADEFLGRAFDPTRSKIGQAILAGRNLLADDITDLASPGFVNACNYGAAIVAPLTDAHGVRGAVVLIRTRERGPFSAPDLELVTTFAAQVAFALDREEARAVAESLRTIEDRHRIAAELHDHVIQRLFATGVGLESLAQNRLPDDLAARLREHIEVLDDTITEIRHRILTNQEKAPSAARSLRLPLTNALGDPGRRD